MAKSRQFRKKQNGGAGASDHVIGVVGGIGQQVAVPGSNVIAMRDVTAPPVVPVKGGALIPLTPANVETVPVVPVKGGAVPLTPAPVTGGGVMQDVAVPAVLLLANSALRRTKRIFNKRSSSSKRRSSNRRRRSSRRR
jgi:hypothetical protein